MLLFDTDYVLSIATSIQDEAGDQAALLTTGDLLHFTGRGAWPSYAASLLLAARHFLQDEALGEAALQTNGYSQLSLRLCMQPG